MQYGNPYFAQPFQQIQPYQDRLAQLQNSYQQAMPYGQAQIQQPMPQVPQIPMLQGQMVDGIDTVKAKDVNMSGNPVIIQKQMEQKYIENNYRQMEEVEFLFIDL